jgi:hypothetical protein
MLNSKLIFLGAGITMLLGSCEIPKDTIVFANDNNLFQQKKYYHIPSSWDAFLLPLGGKRPWEGGE